MQRYFPLIAIVLACADPPGEVLAAVPLTPEEQLTRLSISLRGTRPTIAQLDDVARQPARVDRYVDAWLQTPAFGRTLRDLHAEVLLLRVAAGLVRTAVAVGEPAAHLGGEVEVTLHRAVVVRIAVRRDNAAAIIVRVEGLAVAAHRSLSFVGVEKVIAKGRREDGRRRAKAGEARGPHFDRQRTARQGISSTVQDFARQDPGQ